MDVDAIAKLAKIPLTLEEKKELQQGFIKVLKVLEALKKIDVSHVEPTHQVSGLENVFREDEIDTSRMFTVEQALSNAPKKYNGYFVVAKIL